MYVALALASLEREGVHDLYLLRTAIAYREIRSTVPGRRAGGADGKTIRTPMYYLGTST